MKIAINSCFGGFNLSPKALARLAELQGKKIYFFDLLHDRAPLTLEQAEDASLFFIAYSVPNPQDYRLNERDADGLYREANARADEISIDSRPTNRVDPLLIQVIEELGDKASGRCAKLRIIEIPDGTDWVIEEYDGVETVAESHATWN